MLHHSRGRDEEGGVLPSSASGGPFGCAPRLHVGRVYIALYRGGGNLGYATIARCVHVSLNVEECCRLNKPLYFRGGPKVSETHQNGTPAVSHLGSETDSVVVRRSELVGGVRTGTARYWKFSWSA